MNTAPQPPSQRQSPDRQTVRLAVIFTLFMLVVGFLLVKFGMQTGASRSEQLWVQTEPATAGPGEQVTLAARVTDARHRPVAGFALEFRRGPDLLGRAATDDAGWASVSATFSSAGTFQVDVSPAPTEKRDFRVANRAVIEVLVQQPNH